MGLTENDIEIIQKPLTKKEKEEKKLNQSDTDDTTRAIVHWNPENNHTWWGFCDIDKPVLDGDAYIQSLYDTKWKIWDPVTKTGIGSYFTEEFARSLVLLHGTPKFPIEIGDDGLPVLDKEYKNMWIISSIEDYRKYYPLKDG